MREPELSRLIAKELRSDQNRRFLNRMPAFKPAVGMPDTLRALLERLQDDENGRKTVRY